MTGIVSFSDDDDDEAEDEEDDDDDDDDFDMIFPNLKQTDKVNHLFFKKG
jgi:hypothetical protein